MKLYRTENTFDGSQAAARATSKALAAPWTEFEWPTSKPEVIAALNQLCAGIAVNSGPETLELLHFQSTPPMSAPSIQASRDYAASVARDVSIEEAIAEADHARLIRLAEHIHFRLMELARGAGQ